MDSQVFEVVDATDSDIGIDERLRKVVTDQASRSPRAPSRADVDRTAETRGSDGHVSHRRNELKRIGAMAGVFAISGQPHKAFRVSTGSDHAQRLAGLELEPVAEEIVPGPSELCVFGPASHCTFVCVPRPAFHGRRCCRHSPSA